MDDLIPFLIVIAISIVGSVARNKKKRDAAKNITSAPQNKKQDDIFSWLEKLSGEEEQPIPYQQPVQEESIQQPKTIIEQVENKQTAPPKKATYQKKEKVTEKVKLEDDLTKNIKSKQQKSKQNTQFNLRKAVIYSEILNRKYN